MNFKTEDKQMESGRSKRQWSAYIEHKIRQGTPSQSLINEIVSEGWSQKDAEELVNQVAQSQRSKGMKILGCSTILFLAGLIITISTISSASEEGIIWYGAILCGLIGIIYGITRIIKAR